MAARELPDGAVEIVDLLVRHPGFVRHKQDGELDKPPGGSDGLWRPQVKWTAQKAAAGPTPAEPALMTPEQAKHTLGDSAYGQYSAGLVSFLSQRDVETFIRHNIIGQFKLVTGRG
ncbi:hypothetical protein [Mycolicibacterium farcinogenes]|uniref:Uncharacterized protein n=1 Tax=Mycolicibacterium farcinogenes TaxID=1802 RepID=A0ACD1FIW5_MYCFR|nr:hypothetical protein [Mycolicibacterium farcinogenes]QZH66974.1 hypothetical protein K6L26_04650 [Mycolicibacterium farcinogenes]